MGSVFNYIYYRACKAFYKWDGMDGNRAIWAVTMVQSVILWDILLASVMLLWGHEALHTHAKVSGIIAVGLLFVLMFVNGSIYDGRYEEFDKLWRNESENKRILKGLFVVLSMILPWIGLFLASKLKTIQ